MTRWTEQDLRQVTGRLQAQIADPLAPKPKASKYHNVRCVFEGQIFDSKRELRCYKDFKLLQLSGDIRAVIRQVSFCLPGAHRRMRVDFLVIENDGRHRWYDAKGIETQAWSLKAAQIKDAYGIEVVRI